MKGANIYSVTEDLWIGSHGSILEDPDDEVAGYMGWKRFPGLIPQAIQYYDVVPATRQESPWCDLGVRGDVRSSLSLLAEQRPRAFLTGAYTEVTGPRD